MSKTTVIAVVSAVTVLELGRSRGMHELVDSYESLVTRRRELDNAFVRLQAAFRIAEAINDEAQMRLCVERAKQLQTESDKATQELLTHPLPGTINAQMELLRSFSLRGGEVGSG